MRADDLAAAVIAAALARAKIPLDRVDEVILGCANQAGEDNRNVARMALLLAGLPVSVPGVTVNRLCGSGMQAIADAARLIATGEADLVVAGGVEQMTRAPLVMGKPDAAFPRGSQTLYDTTLGWRFVNPKMDALHETLPMGETAERVAVKYNVSREAQDRFAHTSQQRAAAAIAAGSIAGELVPITVGVDKKTGAFADEIVPYAALAADEGPRADTSLEKMATLKTVREGGKVTAAVSSQVSDGAAALLLASEAAVRTHGLTPLARIHALTVVGSDPIVMLDGPIAATERVLGRAGLAIGDIDQAEVNEAFAPVVLAWLKATGADPARTNPLGGAIALGHPLGATGARLMVTLVHALRRSGGRYGLQTMCEGIGMANATVIERC